MGITTVTGSTIACTRCERTFTREGTRRIAQFVRVHEAACGGLEALDVDERPARVREARERGDDWDTIAATERLSRQSLRRWLQSHGHWDLLGETEPGVPASHEALHQRLAAARDRGDYWADIAAREGIPTQMLHAWVSRHARDLIGGHTTAERSRNRLARLRRDREAGIPWAEIEPSLPALCRFLMREGEAEMLAELRANVPAGALDYRSAKQYMRAA